MLFVLNKENWSVLGTLGISGVIDGEFKFVEYSNEVDPNVRPSPG